MAEGSRIPLICVDRSSADVFSVFDPNKWSRPSSRSVIYSSASELATLQYTRDRIEVLSSNGLEVCRSSFESLQRSWGDPSPDLDRVVCFAQVSELHVLIEGFFAGLKSLVDLVVQLLSTEGIVSAAVDGFHREKGVFGGALLNTLSRNVPQTRKAVAESVRVLLLEHKARWLDDAIRGRDALVHPARGAQQLMFGLVLAQEHGSLALREAKPPQVRGVPIHEYASARVADVRELAVLLLSEIQRAA